MSCGHCSSHLAVSDDESSTAILSLAFRFAEAHVHCGYMTRGQSTEVDENLDINDEAG